MQPTPLRHLLLLGTGLLAACGTEPAPSSSATSSQPVANHQVVDARLGPDLVADVSLDTWRAPELATLAETVAERPGLDLRPPRGGRAPAIGRDRLFSNSGAFTFPGGTIPGSASVTLAPVFDFNSSNPPTLGGGGYDVTVAGANHQSNLAESLAEVLDDGTGASYLLVSAWTIEIDPVTLAEIGTVVHLIVPSSDFAIGATIAFDGVDRMAFFARGDISLPDPTVAAAAITGDVTFTAGGLAVGDQISFTLAGDFGEITWQSQPPPPPPVVGNITPGAWTLQYDPTAYVECDGTLLGQEPAFLGVTPASIGFVDGPIAITSLATDQLDLSGAPINSGFGGANLIVEAFIDAPPGTYVGMANVTGVGPLSTALVQSFLLLDDSTATATWVGGQAGVAFVTADDQGYCTANFALELVP